MIKTNIESNGIASVTLNRPAKRNAFNDEMVLNLQTIFDDLANDNEVRLIVLNGAGDHFCAGADLNWMKAIANYSLDENLKDANKLATMLHTLHTIKKPTIACVKGACFGGAVGLVACCDIALAEETALFCFSEVKLGLIPAVISPYVINAMGRRQAMRYMMSAEVMSSVLAFELGLVHEVFEQSEFEQKTTEFIKQLLANGPNALQELKQLVTSFDNQNLSQDNIQQMTTRAIAQVRSSNEGQEGISAFLEKRTPAWKS